MNKLILPLIIMLSCLVNTDLAAQTPTAKNALTISETLNLLKGKWRYMYKIIDGEIIHERSFRMGNRNAMGIDTNQIHSYTLDKVGRTTYYVDYQDPDGGIKTNELNSSGNWDLQRVTGGVHVVIRDAYFKGCPEIRRRIVRINKNQMLLEDPDSGDKFYYKKAIL